MIEAAKEEGLKQSMVYQARKELGAQIVNTDGHKSPTNRWKWLDAANDDLEPYDN